ncbi:MAG: peptidylprolyl isomerase [Bacteroidota bacterium]
MRNIFLKSCLLVLATILVGTTASFAQPKKVVADKIVGKVGDRIILSSDIFNAISDIKRQGGQLPDNPECILMEGELIKKALVIQAEKDSLPVSDDEIDALLDNQIRGFIQQYGSKEVLEEVAGKTIYQMKEDFKIPFKEKKLAEAMRAKIVDNIKITPTEVKEYWSTIPKDSLPFYESEIELGKIVIYPKASRDIESYTAKQLNDIKRQIEVGGKKFEQMAKLYTEDPGSKETGGQYNINRNDKFWDPVFISTAFKLKEGQISSVVKSKFGLHIIQLVSRAGDDAVVRHILMIPQVTEDEINEAKAKLDSIQLLLASGKIQFGEAVSKYSDEEESKFTGGMQQSRNGGSFLSIDELDKEIIPLLKTLKAGQFSKPQAYTDERGKKGVRVVYLRTRTEPHRENLKDDYNRIATRALEEKKQNTLEKWFATHISNYYIYIDSDFQNCSQLDTWKQQALASKQ